MKAKSVIVSVIVAVVVLGPVGWRIYQKQQENVGKKSVVTEIAVDAVAIERRDIRDLRLFTGSLTPWTAYDVAAKVSGNWMREGEIHIGEVVTPGQFIGKIDDSDYREELEQAQANYNVSLAQLEEAKILLEQRIKEFDRQKELTKVNAKAIYESAEYAVKSQEAAVKVKGAELARQAALLNIARNRVADTEVVNQLKIDGAHWIVADKMVALGDLVVTNQPIVRLEDIGRLKAVINVIEKDYGSLRFGQEVDLTTDAYPEKTFKGKIIHIAQSLQSKSRQAQVEIEVPNPDLQLKPGMFTRAYLEFGSRANAQLVPRSSVIRRQEQTGVFLLEAVTRKALFRPVHTGIVVGDKIEVISPELKYPVITLGNHLLADMANVLPPEQFRKKDE